MDCKEIRPVNPERNQPWILVGRTDAEADTLADLLEKTLMLGKIEGKRRRGWQRMRRLGSITESIMKLSKHWEIVEDRVAWLGTAHSIAKRQHDSVTEQQQLKAKVLGVLLLLLHHILCMSSRGINMRLPTLMNHFILKYCPYIFITRSLMAFWVFMEKKQEQDVILG